MVNGVFQQLVFGHPNVEPCEVSKDWCAVAKIEEQELKLAEAQNDVLSLVHPKTDHAERMASESMASFMLTTSTMLSHYLLSYPAALLKWRMMVLPSMSMRETLTDLTSSRNIICLWSGLPSVAASYLITTCSSLALRRLIKMCQPPPIDNNERKQVASRWMDAAVVVSRLLVYTLTFPTRHLDFALNISTLPTTIRNNPLRRRPLLSELLLTRSIFPCIPDMYVSSIFYLLDHCAVAAYYKVWRFIGRRMGSRLLGGSNISGVSTSVSNENGGSNYSHQYGSKGMLVQSSQHASHGYHRAVSERLASAYGAIYVDIASSITTRVLLYPLESALLQFALNFPPSSLIVDNSVSFTARPLELLRYGTRILLSVDTYRGLDSFMLAELVIGWACLEGSYVAWRWMCRRHDQRYSASQVVRR